MEGVNLKDCDSLQSADTLIIIEYCQSAYLYGQDSRGTHAIKLQVDFFWFK